MLKINKKLVFMILTVLTIVSCGGDPGTIDNFEVGNDLYPNGKIESFKKAYSFPGYKSTERNTYKDYINYIYFEGDTLCFSFDFNGKFNEKDVKVYFYFPDKKLSLNVERLEVKRNRVYGFSLIGSLLEYYYYDLLDEKYNNDSLVRTYDVEIIIEIKSNNNNYTFKEKTSFSIQ